MTAGDGARLRDGSRPAEGAGEASGPGEPGAGGAAPQDGAAFIRAHTRLAAVPLVPEISLHVAADAFDLWQHTEQQAGREQLPPPFWGFPWAGGQALARYVLDHPGTVRDRTVLDIASGSGLVAIAAVRAGAEAVTASEIDPLAAAAITLNCAANGVRPPAIVGDVLSEQDEAAAVPGAGVVLVGDAFYERSLAGRLLPFLERARTAGAVVLVGDPGRAYLPRDQFEPVASYPVPVSRVLEDANLKETTIWRFR